MALTAMPVKTQNQVWGNKKIRTLSVTLDASYPTGGYDLSPAQVGLKAIGGMLSHGPFRKNDNSTAVLLAYDVPNRKLVAYSIATGNQVAGATDLSTFSGRLTFVSS